MVLSQGPHSCPLISLMQPGTTARFRFLRDSTEVDLPIVIGTRPNPKAAPLNR